jgi:hypothetical protein
MTNRFLAMLLPLGLSYAVTAAQTPESFFPHNVGDRWDYRDLTFGNVLSMKLTRDSIGADMSNNLFYNSQPTPDYRIDTSNSVYWIPQNPFLNHLVYKLPADSGEAWLLKPRPNFGYWVWVARIESAIVFSQRTVVKVIRYSPGHPDSGGASYYLEEHWLASGFGLIYTWRHPSDITYLQGCIIAGDTFGFLTAVPQIRELPREHQLEQNFPNPFNPTTAIKFDLPEAGNVSLVVYDVLGREVAELATGYHEAGYHSATWNAAGHASGVYFARFTATDTFGKVRLAKTSKILLMK